MKTTGLHTEMVQQFLNVWKWYRDFLIDETSLNDFFYPVTHPRTWEIA